MAGKEGEQMTRRQVITRSVGAAAAAAAGGMGLPGEAADRQAAPHRLAAVPIRQVAIDDPFWSPRLKAWREVTIADSLHKFENDHGGAIHNFDLVAEGKTGTHAGPPWYDGLVYEMIRGIADFLVARRDRVLEARVDGYIARIAAAQAVDPTGYLNTWTTMMAPQEHRWGMNGGDDRWQHDLYNGGMLVEAGVHYYRATRKPLLLEVATRMANLMCDRMGPAPRANVIPGHSGPEEALVKLYELYAHSPAARRAVSVPVTPRRYLELAESWIDARGHHERRTSNPASFGEYGQDHAPLARQASLEGHAVRATLFSTGIAAAANVTGRADYLAALHRFWHSMADRRMYITGAAGAVAADERFGADYYLPNDGYMETCAAVGLGFFAHNMNLLFGDASYVDELERALYNAVPAGVQVTGNRYFYQCPLTGNGLSRWEWHDCPCCPPMFVKIVGALPGYLYAQEPGALYVNLYIGSRASVRMGGSAVSIRQVTRYPWEGSVCIQVDPAHPTEFDLCLRLPAWCAGKDGPDALYSSPAGKGRGYTVRVNGKAVGKATVVRGYLRLRRRWQAGDRVELVMDMPVRQVHAHRSVEAARGRVAIARGPVVYCAETVDNPLGIINLVVPSDARFAVQYRPGLLGGVAVARGKVRGLELQDGAAQPVQADLTLIPFFASSNRQLCAMDVWLPAEDGMAIPASIATRSRPSASHCWHLDSVGAINDGRAPATSSDLSQPRLSWWDHKGGQEWAQLDFLRPAPVSVVRLYWFADRPTGGGCDLPASWRLLYREGEAWLPVTGATGYGVETDRFNEVRFDRVTTGALRIEVQMREGWSAGICEWQVE